MANFHTCYLSPPDHWRASEFAKTQGLDSVSAAVRRLIDIGWKAHLKEIEARHFTPAAYKRFNEFKAAEEAKRSAATAK